MDNGENPFHNEQLVFNNPMWRWWKPWNPKYIANVVDGVTKREAMAMHMMSAIISSSPDSLRGSRGKDNDAAMGDCAKKAVRCADMLLAELDK